MGPASHTEYRPVPCPSATEQKSDMPSPQRARAEQQAARTRSYEASGAGMFSAAPSTKVVPLPSAPPICASRARMRFQYLQPAGIGRMEERTGKVRAGKVGQSLQCWMRSAEERMGKVPAGQGGAIVAVLDAQCWMRAHGRLMEEVRGGRGSGLPSLVVRLLGRVQGRRSQCGQSTAQRSAHSLHVAACCRQVVGREVEEGQVQGGVVVLHMGERAAAAQRGASLSMCSMRAFFPGHL